MAWTALSLAARTLLGLCAALLLLELGRASPLATWSLGLSVPGLCALLVASGLLAALNGCVRPPWRWRPWLAALAAALLGLGLLAGARGRVGLAALASSSEGTQAWLPAAALDLLPSDLDNLPAARKRTLVWAGALRFPRPGPYALRLEVQGRATLDLDGGRLLQAQDGAAETVVVVLAGERPLRVEAVGRALRVRLAWTPPTRHATRGERLETVPARQLGPARARAWWWALDLMALVAAALAGVLLARAPWERPRVWAADCGAMPREGLWAFLAYAALAALLTWPLLSGPASLGPWHRPDGRLNAWILGWNAHALLAQPGRIFQAPAFHPLPDSLAFTESLCLPGLLAAPVTRAWGPAAGYNLVFLASLLSAALGTRWLARRAGADALASWAAGALFSFGAWRFANWAHLHAHATLFLPWGLVALVRFLEQRSLPRALVVAACLAAQALTSVYLGAIQAVAAAAWALVSLCRPLDARALARLAAAGALGALLVSPAFLPYFRMRSFQGVEFTLDDVRAYATTAESYLAAYSGPWAALAERHLPAERVREPLFPGLVTLALGLAGLASATRRWRVPLLAAAALCVLLSLGPETAVYRQLHAHFVPLRALRALGRFALVPLLCLALWAGLALSGRRVRTVLAALFLALAENAQWPARVVAFEPPGPAAHALAGGRGAVLHWPLGVDDTRAMLEGLAHRRPLLNGDSGFVPRPYARLAETLGEAPWDERLRLLRALGVSEVIAREELPLGPARQLGDQRIYTVPPGPAAQAPGHGHVWSVSPSGPPWRLDLGAVRQLRTLDFELSDAPWLARPRLRLSADGRDWYTTVAEASLADATLSLYVDPRHGRGRLRLAAPARFVELDPALPLRGDQVQVAWE